MTRQLELDIKTPFGAPTPEYAALSLDVKRLSRSTDAQTSHAAAERVAEFSGKHAAAIFAWLKDHPAGGTAHEIAKGTGIDAVAVSRRIKGLRDTAGVYDSGETRATPTGRQATVWRVR